VASMRDQNAIVVLTNSEAGMSAAKELVSAAISGANECLDFPMLR